MRKRKLIRNWRRTLTPPCSITGWAIAARSIESSFVRVKTDARSGLVSDPNRSDEPRFILDSIARVATVALETGKLVGQLPRLFAEKI